MSKLIGTSPNQVPSNADLGTAAFMDKNDFLLSKGSSLEKVESTFTENTSSMFLYDTTLDSDGGAWRHRCTHTSWYNEELNTYRRGARKEFPQVALITIENGASIMIYDVSDGNPNMWMRSSIDRILGFAANGISCVHALNRLLVIGQNDGSGSNYDGLKVIDFIRDDGFWTWNQTNSAQYGTQNGLISGVTNISSRGWPFLINDGESILAKEIIDLDMRVLPNAPIDPVTKIAKPTIVCSTTSGIFTIKDNGRVYDWSSLIQNAVKLTDDHMYIGYGGNGRVYVDPIVTRDVATYAGGLSNGVERHYRSTLGITELDDDLYYIDQEPSEQVITNEKISILEKNKFAVATNGGISVFDENETAPERGMVAYIGHNFNTGYNLGNIVFSGMCSTNTGIMPDTDVLYNHVENGTFDSNTNGWDADSNTGGSFNWNPAGYATITRGTGDSTYAIAQNISTLSGGEHVRVKFSLYPDNTGRIRIRLGGSKEQWFSTTLTANAWQTIEFTAIMEGGRIEIASNGGAGITSFSIDNVSIIEVEPDVRHDGRGAQFIGNVAKVKVRPGADMTAFTNFASANYLDVPYAEDLNLGTGDFTIMLWVNSAQNQDYRAMLSYGDYGVTAEAGWVVRTSLGSGVEFRTDAGGGNSLISNSNGALIDNQWHHICFTRKGSSLKYYQDGKFIQEDGTFATDIGIANGASLNIGYNANDSMDITKSPFIGYLSMAKISKTAITEEQLSKIYESEKMFFTENSKVTLHGTSSEVRAVDYDQGTGYLHAGTPQGRSVFSGLSRIDQTDIGVERSISAINGMVAED